jgi:hypothetical protein
MIDLKLHHIGEPLVARMLQAIDAAGLLSTLVCERTGVSIESDIVAEGLQPPVEFLPERASLGVSTDSRRWMCDGAQKVDVLCAGKSNRAMAFELKLGEERLRTNEFKKRFLNECSRSHGDSRLKGTMIAVLDRRLSQFESAALHASIARQDQADEVWEVVRPWWLVVRRSVWLRWEQSGVPGLNHGRVLVFENMVREFGGKTAFNDLVRELVCGSFFEEWRLGQ